MDLPSHIFRAYDIRGLVGEEVNEEVFFKVGLAFGQNCRLKGLRGVALGGDNRPSTAPLSSALADGIIASGVDVFDVGLQPTPVVYFARHMLKGVGVAVVTASHNPKEYNGVKLGYKDAALSEEEIQDILALARTAGPAGVRGQRRRTDIHEAYVDEWTRLIGGPHGLRVVVDCGNGTAGLYEPALSARGAGSAEGLFVEMDADYPNHHPDPSVEENLQALSREVLRQGADRLGLIDDKGRFVALDRLMVLLWQDILKAHPGATALIEVKCSRVLYEAVARLGGHPEFCRSGHAPMKILMRKRDTPFAGELSGHFFFRDSYYGYDDGFYAAGRVYRLLGEGGASLSERLAALPPSFATPEVRFEVADREKFAKVQRMAEMYKEAYPVITVDGVRVEFPRGWALVRASNTQPVAVFRAEGETERDLRRILEDVVGRAERGAFPELAEAIRPHLEGTA